MTSENWKGYIYEHIIVAEEFLGRSLTCNEVVHHLDCDRSNNRIENLIVLDRSQHVKLHEWINRGAPICESVGMNGMNSVKSKVNVYCEECLRTLQHKQKRFCSRKCRSIMVGKTRPDKKTLQGLIKTNSYVGIGKIYNVSGNAVRKWAKNYGLL